MTKITIGGQERTLNFETWGFLEFAGEWTKDDPFNVFDISIQENPVKATKAIQAIIYGGLMNAYSEENKEPDFTKEDIVKWVRGLKLGEIKNVFMMAATLNTPEDAEKNVETQGENQPNP